MHNHQRFVGILDTFLALVLTAIVLGATLAFGGGVPWARPILFGLAALWVLGLSVRMILTGSWKVLRSPLTGLGFLGVMLAIAQLVPLPTTIANRLSPRAVEVYATGVLSTLANADDPDPEPIEAAASRSPLSLDRPATLRWAMGAMLCLGLFWGVSHYTDRQSRLYLVWGMLLCGMGINSVLAVVQLSTGADGAYGFIQPGGGHLWEPSLADVLAAPGASVLRSVDGTGNLDEVWAVPKPDHLFLIGTTLGGSGAFLGLAALGLPLAMALALQILSPRGSRESIAARLSIRGRGSLLAILLALILLSGILVGVFAGRWMIIPFALGVAIVGVPACVTHGLRWSGLGLTVLGLSSLAIGLGLGHSPWISPEARTVARPGHLADIQASWSTTARVIRDFPLTGVGFGGFATVEPFYKRQDVTWSTSSSSLLQWCAESGLVGASLMGLAALWGLWRLPGSMRRVGTADRSLAYGMLGAGVAFGVFSLLHWSIELPSLAISASALGGTYNRWLAGGTDLFVERS